MTEHHDPLTAAALDLGGVEMDELPPVHALADPSQLYDFDIEAGCIGACIGSGQLPDDLAPIDFHDHKLQEICRALLDLRASNMAIDIMTVCDALTRAGKLEAAGGEFYVQGLLTVPSSSQNAGSLWRIVRDYAARRRMLAEASDMARRAVDLKTPIPESATQPARKNEWSIPELLDTVFSDPGGPLPGVFPIGETLVGGRPKKGKSTLMRQFAVSAGQGGRFLNREVGIRKTLLYALEDRPQRLKKHLIQLGVDRGAILTVRQTIPPLHLGGLAEIERAFTEEEYSIVILDTLWRSMPGIDNVKEGALFSDILGKLQEIALRETSSFIAVVQNRKPNGMTSFQPVDDVCGSTGLVVAADAVIGLYTEQGKPGARLIGESRDAEPFDWKMHLDHELLCWQLDGETDEIKMSDERAAILAALEELGKAQVGTIAKTVGADYGNTHRKLSALWTAGEIRKETIEGKTYYERNHKENNEVHT